MPSLYERCAKAVDELIVRPPRDKVFTEMDVVNRASRSRWTKDTYKNALKEANQFCGTQYRLRKLCRYGPVTLPDGTQDYARIASRIVYADAETGPKEWTTPNGKFPKLMIEDDKLKTQGRRRGAARNDLLAWDDPSEAETPDPEPEVDGSQRQITQLQADLSAAIGRANRAEEEAARLRAHKANGDGDGDLSAQIEDLNKRLANLEDRVPAE